MFPTTRWSELMVLNRDPAQRQELFRQLAVAYWQPLYRYARLRGLAHAVAEDVVQGLFASLLHGESVANIDPARGRLRSFLKACLDHHLADCRAHAGAHKRGGNVVVLPIEAAEHVGTT